MTLACLFTFALPEASQDCARAIFRSRPNIWFLKPPEAWASGNHVKHMVSEAWALGNHVKLERTA